MSGHRSVWMCCILDVVQILDLNTQTIDVVLAFPWSDSDVPVYTKIPAGTDLEGPGAESSKYSSKLNHHYMLWSRQALGITSWRQLHWIEALWSLYQTHVYISPRMLSYWCVLMTEYYYSRMILLFCNNQVTKIRTWRFYLYQGGYSKYLSWCRS